MSLSALPSSPTPLPVPAKPRWQPLRSGLLNLYRYDHEEFWFEDGHLLLRGNNGTGKSRVLALQLPFLFDGEVLPSRVEPDGDPAKKMEWNLLMGRYEDRVGYTWLELGRVTETGEPEYLTLGCGLSATQGQSSVNKWFFITPQRIGETLFLQSAGGQPLARDRLKELLTGAGELFSTAQAYRDGVDARLFKLGRHRYEALVALLIQLRKPQLSRALDQQQLAGALREALPPLTQKVVDDIAEAFRALEHERVELESFKSASAAVDRFLESYRRYVQVAVRQRAAAVRTAHSAYEEGQRKVRVAEQRLQSDTEALQKVEADLKATRLENATATAEAAALEQSEVWRDARTLAERKQRAETVQRVAVEAAEEATDAERRLHAHQGHAKAMQQRVEASTAKVDAAVSDAASAAEAASFGTRWRELQQRVLAPTSDHDTLAEVEPLLSERRRALDFLGKLTSSVNAGKAELRRASDEHLARSGELEQAIEEEGDQRRAFDAAREALLTAVEAWAERVQVLKPGSYAALEAEVLAWCEDWDAPFPLEEQVKELYAAVITDVAARRAERHQRSAEVKRALFEAEALHSRLAEGHHPPPAAPHTRSETARQPGSPGAPLWRLCDFHPSVPAEARAGLEAALEASGLLDAWVTPEGLQLPQGTHDVVLGSAQALPEGVPSLADFLLPSLDESDDGAKAVGTTAVAAILRTIGGAEGASEHWVDARGTFRLGPLSGSWMKAAAEHLGHAAREASRREALARVEATLAALHAEAAAIEESLRSLDRIQEQAKAEASSTPKADAVRRAGQNLAHATKLVRSRRELVATVEAKLSRARLQLQTAEAELGQAARDLALEAWTGRLDELRHQTDRFRSAAARLGSAVDALRRDARDLERSAQDVVEGQRALGVAHERATRAEREAAEARAHWQALQDSVGKNVEELSRQLASARRRADESQKAELILTGRQGELQGACRAADEAIAHARGAQEQARQMRTDAVQSLANLAALGFLTLAHPALTDVPDGEWTPSRGVDVSRELENALGAVDASAETWSRLGNQLQGRFQALMTELAPSGLFHPDATMPDGVFHVQVTFQNQRLKLDALCAVLNDEVLQRQTLLDQRERELLENHLLGEVASHLHGLLHEAAAWVDAVNEELGKSPTSTGMALRFKWDPSEDGPNGLQEARRLMLRNQATWTPEQRRTVGSFLKAQIDRVRAEAAEATWQEHLSLAFDYRNWHTFSIERHQDGRWQKLTRRTHGTGSGGEKAIALTLPQFAAAAAHYRSAAPTAPRLILLDEAFVGIDSDMRGKCMGLLSAFDLDFVMTSEREWGCYGSLPGVAICQLTSRVGIDAVHVTRFVWNGRARLPANIVLPPAQAPEVEA